jgi:hypothetical protein
MIDLRKPYGPALSLAELGAIVGLSSQTLRREAALGELAVIRVGPKRRHLRVPWMEARRYCRQLGLLSVPSSA